MDIICARSGDEIDMAREQFREYETFLDFDLCLQNFESELAGLPGQYAPPDGALFLLMRGTRAIGCCALKRFGPHEQRACEVKRLFVQPEARGLGMGRKLATRIVEEGVRLGYGTMFLDTQERFEAAMALYESISFVRTKP
jgi:putative acetyltransferase